MSGIYYKDKLRANVTIPNPQDAATDDLEKVKIDGTTYAVGGADTLSDLTDTEITSPSDEDVLQYDDSASKWINVTWTAFKAKLKTYFDTIYAKISSLAAHATVPLDNTTLKIGSDGSDSAVYSTCTKSTYYPSTSTLSLATKTDFNVTQLQEVFVPQVDIAEKSDTAPYIYRASVANGDRVCEDIVGASVGWNQLVPTNAWGTSGIFTNNGDGSYTINGTITSAYFPSRPVSIPTIKGHKYFLSLGIGSSTNDIYITINGVPSSANIKTSGIITHTSDSFIVMFALAGTYNNVKVWPNVIDLTLVFGATIADHIYALEQATAGAGVAFFRKYFTASYYPYNAGELLSVEVEGKKYGNKNLVEGIESGIIDTTTGQNTTGSGYRTKNHLIVKPSQAYTISGLKSNSAFRVFYYDISKNFLGSEALTNVANYKVTFTTWANAGYIRFQAGAAIMDTTTPVQCEIGNTATTYTPYHLTTYTFPSQTLRGLFTLVNGELKASGDVYGDDGVVARKYGIVDLGSLTWNVSNTNGFYAPLPESKTGLSNLVCSKYPYDNTVNFAWANFNNYADKTIYKNTSSTSYLYVKDTSYSDKTTFTNAMSGVYLVYELATPTTEQAEPLVMPQICDKNGTEEFITTSIVPVGHESTYYNYPDYMEEGEYKDFRDRVDYAPEKAKWHQVGIYANGDTITIDGYYNEIMLVPNHYSGTTLLACASPAIFPFSLFKSITLQNSTESERIDITPAGVVGVTGTYFSNVTVFVR